MRRQVPLSQFDANEVHITKRKIEYQIRHLQCPWRVGKGERVVQDKVAIGLGDVNECGGGGVGTDGVD